MRVCAVPSCLRTESSVLHKLPTNPAQRLIWLQLCRQNPLSDVKELFVCSGHFKISDFQSLTKHKKLVSNGKNIHYCNIIE